LKSLVVFLVSLAVFAGLFIALDAAMFGLRGLSFIYNG